MKISAIQAAQLTGRSERRIRDWIAKQRLPAVKVGQAWQIDIEDLERLPGITIDHEQLALLQSQAASSTQGILIRLAKLERTVEDLYGEIACLSTRLERMESQYQEKVRDTLRQRAAGYVLEPPEDFSYGAESESLPSGSIRVKQFALQHKVHAAVLTYQIETDKIEDTAVSTANGRKAHWLTPEQQRAVIAFWQRNGTHFVPCPNCPHY